MNLYKIISTVVFAFSLLNLQAQVSINSSGGEASSNQGVITYSIGMVSYHAIKGSNGSVEEGVQQTLQISNVTGIDKYEGGLLLSVYPNPVVQELVLEVNYSSSLNLSYQLYDLNGTLIDMNKITKRKSVISMSNLVPSIYFIKIIEGTNDREIFKIIKSND